MAGPERGKNVGRIIIMIKLMRPTRDIDRGDHGVKVCSVWLNSVEQIVVLFCHRYTQIRKLVVFKFEREITKV